LKVFAALSYAYNKILDALYFAVGIALVFVMLTVTVGIITRYFFSVSLGWSAEISGYVLIPLALLAAPKMLRDGGHIKVDLISNAVSPKINSFLVIIGSVLGAAVFSLLTLAGSKITIDMLETGYRTDTFLRVPRFILIGISVLGLLLMTVQFLRNIIKTGGVLTEKQKPPSEEYVENR
jgi:TRAP-type C4-dicarboxylate transport system permease small subunit